MIGLHVLNDHVIELASFKAVFQIFCKNILGDVLCTPALQDSEIALYDINPQRLKESEAMLTTLNRNINGNKATIKAYCGVENRKEALRGADFAVNAIRVWDYTISEAIDFAIPTKYGLRQTIADTLGIGGLFRALGSGEHMLHFAEDMAEVCPNAWFLNYTNPMCALTGLLLRHTPIKTVGLCHSVQAWHRKRLRHDEIQDAHRGYQPPGVAAGIDLRRKGHLSGNQETRLREA